MEMPVAILFYGVMICVIVLLCVAGGRNGADRTPRCPFKPGERSMVDFFVWLAIWWLLSGLIVCGAVDVGLWASKTDRANVSDTIHFYLQLYPWLGWIAAGLVYHLLVDRPAPPWR